MEIERFKMEVVADQFFGENTYIAYFNGQADCIVIDPGLEPAKILTCLEQHALVPTAILITHGHSDHIGGNQALKDRWPDCPLVVAAGDAEKLTDPNLNLSAAFGVPLVSPPADKVLQEPDTYAAAGITVDVLDTPGHSPGHVVFLWKGSAPWVLFGGDVLFRDGIGRTDFPDGSFADLRDSIYQKLFTLPDDTVVLPGHGPPTTIGEEKESNPFVGRSTGYAG